MDALDTYVTKYFIVEENLDARKKTKCLSTTTSPIHKLSRKGVSANMKITLLLMLVDMSSSKKHLIWN